MAINNDSQEKWHLPQTLHQRVEMHRGTAEWKGRLYDCRYLIRAGGGQGEK